MYHQEDNKSYLRKLHYFADLMGRILEHSSFDVSFLN